MIQLVLNAELHAPEYLGRRHLAIAGGKVVWIGSEPPRLPPAFLDAVVDVRGRRLVPGLIDLHAHLTGGGGEAGPETRVPSLALSQFTRAGITSVVGLLGTDTTTRTMADLVAATRGLENEGLNAWCWTGGYQVPPATLTGSVRGDIVHVDRIVGVGELALSDHRSSQPTLDELLRVASDCHVAGMLTHKAGVVHLHMGDGERGLELVRAALDASELPARVFHPTHVNRRSALFDEALELVQRGCTIDLTAFPPPEHEASEDGGGELQAAEGLIRYLDSDLPRERITISSDGGGCLPTFDADGRMTHMDVGRPAALFECLSGLLARGLDLELVLPAFTENPARVLRLQDKGRVEVGGAADLVVLDENHQVADVMIRGRWHVRSGEEGGQRLLGTFEST